MENAMPKACRFKIGDHVMYMGNGICRIDDVRNESFGGPEQRTYYVLHALSDPRSVIYVPTDSEKLTASMLELLTEKEITDIIDTSEDTEVLWISDNKQRAAQYGGMLINGDRADILRVVKALTLHKTEVEKQKKKFYASDERVLAAATKLITEEFSFVLGIGQNEVIPYIIDRIEKAV